MLFDSPIYFLFLVVVVMAYWRLNHRRQNIFLLAASYFFYGWWDWRFLALMVGSTAMDFVIAQKVAPGRSEANRKRWFIFSLALNFGILGVFKYFNFFVDSAISALDALGIHYVPVQVIRILLPPGISFYTFQEVAYIVDVYRGKLEPSKSFVDYALFISLFPHLIAGPIQRPGHLLPQVQKQRAFDPDRIFDGMLLILSGLVRKCVVADNCAVLANAAFGGQLGPPNIWVLFIGTYAFAWQVYGDFSGYSDMARGSAQLMGFHFMVNFRQPFLARRLQDFWRRWHISLSTWLRDYLYIPLGGSAASGWKTSRNLLTTMLLGGLWHGAAWTYVVFGGIHGVVLSLERLIFPSKAAATCAGAAAAPADGFFTIWGQRILTFNLFCLSLVFFRAPTLAAAVEMLGGLPDFTWRSEYGSALLMLSIFALPLFLVDLMLEASGKEYLFAEAPYAVRTATAVVALFLLAFLSGSKLNTFIYFQF